MTGAEFRTALTNLRVSQMEAARLLSVGPRTVRRWVEDGEALVPGPVEQTIRAWVKLQKFGLAWRPDSQALGESESEIAFEIAKLREHNIDLATMLASVEKRGGPKNRFVVDLVARSAKNKQIEVSFYPLPNGGFSPANYRRLDKHPDYKNDLPLLQDAFYCIAEAVRIEGPNWFLR